MKKENQKPQFSKIAELLGKIDVKVTPEMEKYVADILQSHLATLAVIGRPFKSGEIDRREKTIDTLLAAKINFVSDQNLHTDLIKKYVVVKCPLCGKEMKVSGGGGSSQHTTTNYKCFDDGMRISLSMPYDGLSFEFPPENK